MTFLVSPFFLLISALIDVIVIQGAIVVMRWHSSVLTMHCRFAPNKGQTTLRCLYVAVCGF